MGFLGPTSPKPPNPSFSPSPHPEARSLSRTEVGLVGDSSEDAELKTLIATYDIPLELRPRLPDSNFRMSILSVGDTAIGIELTVTLFWVFQTLSKQGDWFSFAKRRGSTPVCMEVTKSGLKQWKEKFFLIDRRAIPFHMPWRHPDSCITDKVPTSFNQDHVDRLKAHIVKLRDIPEGVLVRSGLSRVWRNPMCDPVLRRSDNTVMSIHDFLCMPSLEKATVREEPHELGTSILGRVADRTTPPAPAGTTIPRASLEEIAVTRPDPNVVAKADHAAKRKTSTGPEISTNTTKRTRLSQRVSGAGSSGLAAGDEVEQTDDGTLNDDGQRDGSEFAMEDVGNLNDVGQGEYINVIPLRTFDPSLGLDVTYPPILLPDKEVEAHAELSGGVRRTTRASSHASHGVIEDVYSPAQEAMMAPGTQLLDTDAGANEIASDGNVDSYFDARVSNTVGDVLERGLLSFVPGPYYIPYPYDENNGCESPPYTKDDWDNIHGVNLGLRRKELYKDPKCQLITHGRAFLARYDHSLREESTVHASEEVSGLKAELGALKSKCEAIEHKLSSWDKKHRKYRSERHTLANEKAKIEEELKSQLEHRERQAEEIQGSITSFFQSDFTLLVRRFLKSSEFNRAFTGVLNTAISVGVERGLRMGRTDEEFRGLSQRVAGFISDAKEKFDRVIAVFPDTTFPFLDKPSSATASLRTNTHARHSTSSSGTFGHTSTPEHLKKKKKPVERGGPSAA
ncbi:hypothetical protein Tco_0138893 [Tanacetum coccineum]